MKQRTIRRDKACYFKDWSTVNILLDHLMFVEEYQLMNLKAPAKDFDQTNLTVQENTNLTVQENTNSTWPRVF